MQLILIKNIRKDFNECIQYFNVNNNGIQRFGFDDNPGEYEVRTKPPITIPK